MSANAEMKWNQGEGVNADDFNDARSMLLKAMDDRRFMYAASLVLDPGDYEAQYGLGGGTHVTEGAFTCMITTTTGSRNVTLEPGQLFLGGGEGDTPDSVDDTEAIMTGIIWPGGTVTLPASAGGDTWNLISIPRLAPLYDDGGSESRDFMDAVTRALSSQNVDKRSTAAPALVVTTGTLGGGIPATPVGHAALAAVKIRNGAAGVAVGGMSELLTDVVDYTLPMRRKFVGRLGREGLFAAADWAVSGLMALDSGSAASKVARWYPGDHKGDPAARLLGVIIKHKADEAFTAELVRIDLETDAETVLSTITVGTTDGAYRNIVSFGNGTNPIWCNGAPGGRAIVARGVTGTFWDGSTLALKITSGGGAGAQTTTIAKVIFVLAVP
jgi:hypothetical protein